MPTIQLTPKLTFNLVTGQINIEDLTDYASLGIGSGFTIEGFISIIVMTSSGALTIYNNIGGSTPDITPPSATTNQTPILIPYDSTTGEILLGAYDLQYNVSATDGTTTYTGSYNAAFEYLINTPQVCLETSVNCSASTCMSKDVTDYDQENATLVSLTRAHSLYPPPASRAAVMTANLQTIIYNPIYTTAWQAEVITDLTYLQDNGAYVVLQVSGVKDFQVVCDTNLTKILCCLFQLNKTYEAFIKEGALARAEAYSRNTIIPSWNYLTLFLAATTAGNGTKAADAYAKLLEVSGCENCNCSDEVSVVQVSGSGNGGANITYVVDSPDNSISVTQQVNGNTVTFHVQLSAALQQVIANAVQTQVNTNSAYLTVTPSGTNPRIYTIDWVGPPVPSDQLMNIQATVFYSNEGPGFPIFALNTDVLNKIGTQWIASGDPTISFGTSSPNAGSDIAILRVSGFFDPSIPAAPAYVAWANIMRTQNAEIPVTTAGKQFEAEVFHINTANATGDIYVRLYHTPSGAPMTLDELYDIVRDENVLIQLTINAEP